MMQLYFQRCMLPLPPYRRSKTPIDRANICLALLTSNTNVENGAAPRRLCIQSQNLTAARPSICCHARVDYPPLQPIPRSTLDAILTQAGRSRPLLLYIYLAPPRRHLLAESDELRLRSGPRENNARPALDPLFRSTGASAAVPEQSAPSSRLRSVTTRPAWHSGSAAASPWCKTRAMPPFRKCP
jgi:hypothetical protein